MDATNLDRMVQMLARIEVARLGDVRHGWGQRRFGTLILADDQADRIEAAVEDSVEVPTTAHSYGHLIYDPVTKELEGIGHCRTAFCGAGFALEAAGVQMVFEQPYPAASYFSAFYTIDGRSISEAACEWLGLPTERDWERDGDHYWDQAEDFPALFSADNDIDAMYEQAWHWVNHQECPTEDDLRERVQERTEELFVALIKAGQRGGEKDWSLSQDMLDHFAEVETTTLNQ